MRPGGKSNGESPFFEIPILSFEGRVGNVAGWAEDRSRGNSWMDVLC